MEEIDVIISKLKMNPMFHLSLGSKELFHSNFLEFLWEKDRVAFLRMLQNMMGGTNEKISRMLQFPQNYFLDREKDKFDICIYHTESGEDEGECIYDIIIENKVKSIPNKNQLDRYVKKIKDKLCDEEPLYILISLATDYPDMESIKKEHVWVMVNYDSLLNSLRRAYRWRWVVSQYVRNYCGLIKNLHKLQMYCINDSIDSSIFYQEKDDIKVLLEDIHLHDLYLKMRGSYFISRLLARLQKTMRDSVTISIDGGERGMSDANIILSSGMNNGKSTITGAIYYKADAFYMIQIEGDQYRHMFSKKDLVKNCIDCKEGSKERSIDKVARARLDEKKVDAKFKNMSNASHFLNFKKPLKGLEGQVHNKYCRYAPDIIYRYKKFDVSITFEKMLGIMANDVEQTYKALYPQQNN